jgi:hypothetical protein
VTRDRVLGLILLLVDGLYYLSARALPASDLSDAVGPAGLPKAYAAALAVLALALVVRGRGVVDGPTVSPRVLGRISGLLAIGIAYVVLVPWAGYPLTLTGLIIGTAFYQGGRLDGRVVTVGVLGAAVLWLVFVQVLGVAQPVGAWFEGLLGAP